MAHMLVTRIPALGSDHVQGDGSNNQNDIGSGEPEQGDDLGPGATWEQQAHARQQRAEHVLQAVLHDFCASMPEHLVAGEPVLDAQVCALRCTAILAACTPMTSLRSVQPALYTSIRTVSLCESAGRQCHFRRLIDVGMPVPAHAMSSCGWSAMPEESRVC